jgi:hypothetical protein
MRISASRVTLCCATLLLTLACSKDEPPADTAAAVPPAADATPATPASMLESMRGRWSVRSIPMEGDTTPTAYTLDATGDTATWTLTFEGRTTPVKLHVLSMAGDSIVTVTDEYESVRRRGMRVVTTSVMRPQGDRLTGNVTARYRTTGPDSVLMLRSEGTRMP